MNLPIETSPDQQLIKEIRYNCDVSDARDHGIYSMCSLVLKLRNLYKWEHGHQPWSEPESAELLDWIEARENYWQDISNQEFRPITIQGRSYPADDVDAINGQHGAQPFFYGAGHGRSMKAIFFLGAVNERLSVEDRPVLLLGREYAREMASPFAMIQEGQVIIRTDPLRFFLYDHIQELRSSCRTSLRFFLNSHQLLNDGVLDQQRLADVLDEMAVKELDLFIYHELGELYESSLGSATFEQMIGRFPGSIIEFVCRAVKDVLADTHPRGVLSHIVKERKESTLGLYVSFVDGLRQELFPELGSAWKSFLEHKKWRLVEQARLDCRDRTKKLAEQIKNIADQAAEQSDKTVQRQFNNSILVQLGLEIPEL